MDTFTFIKCAHASSLLLPFDAPYCNGSREYYLPNGWKIKYSARNGKWYINGECLDDEYDYIGSFTYSNTFKKPKVRLYMMYYMVGFVIPEKKVAFFNVQSTFGPITVFMDENETWLGVDSLASFKNFPVATLDDTYVVQFITEVEEAYFGRSSMRQFVEEMKEKYGKR